MSHYYLIDNIVLKLKIKKNEMANYHYKNEANKPSFFVELSSTKNNI
jgi:hypothetical protein